MSFTKYIRPAAEWTEALPLGNGSIGGMVFGGTVHERIALNHDTLWTGKPHTALREGAYGSFLRAKQYALEGKYREAMLETQENFNYTDVEYYLPLGDLLIDSEMPGEISDYSRILDLDSAAVRVSFLAGEVRYTREVFISYPDKVLAIRFSASKEKSLSMTLSLASPLRHSTDCVRLGEKTGEPSRDLPDTLVLFGECPGTSHAGELPKCEYYEYPEKDEDRGIRFAAGVSAIVKGGSAVSCGGALQVQSADECVVLLSVETSFNGYDKLPFTEGKEYIKPLYENLTSAAALGYDALLGRHTDDYRALYGRISLDLGENPGRTTMPTDERLKVFASDLPDAKNDPGLYTLLFDFGRYLTIAGSRKGSQAMNLQGIWNDKLTPPWRSDYTVNINTEMNYWPTLPCGLDECFLPLVDFMKVRSVTGEKTAQCFYNAGGFVLHHNSDIWGHTAPVSGYSQHAFWQGGSGWLCRNLYEYYEYTRDKEYLEKTAYPIMKKAALFYLELLCDRGDGRLSVCPSTSPENAFLYEGGESSVAKYTTMTDSIVYDLFGNCIEAARELGEDFDAEFIADLTSRKTAMSPFAVGRDGRLLEWNEDFREREKTHRHVSHLYGLHPAHLITPEETPELCTACRKTLEARGDAGTGWSLGWKINFYARLRDGDHAQKLLDMQLRPALPDTYTGHRPGGTYPNLFDAHPPFQIDGNFGAVSGILEMLAGAANDGKLLLLPALPSSWKNGTLRGMRLRNGKILDLAWKDGKVTGYTLSERE